MTVRAGGDRGENMDRLFERDPALFFELYWTLLIMQQRGITQRDITRHLRRSRKWTEDTLRAAVGLLTLERNLLEIDGAITEITEEEETHYGRA